MQIRYKVCNLRTGKNLSQDEMAEALNVSRQTISRWECGESIPSMKQMQAISKYFDIPLDIIVNDNMDLPQNKSDIIPDKISATLDTFHDISLTGKFQWNKLLFILGMLSAILLSVTITLLIVAIIAAQSGYEQIYFVEYSITSVDILVIILISLVVVLIAMWSGIFFVRIRRRRKRKNRNKTEKSDKD